MLKTLHTINLVMICVIVVLLLSCRRVPSTQITHATQINLHQSSVFAAEKLKQNQLTSGNWTTFFNIDTVPSFSAWVFDAVYTGMIMVDLLRPVSSVYNLETNILDSWKYVSSQVNPETGLLRFFNLFKDMPEDADDTGLYW
nr:hypothetical protein [Bacteroidota bacterium]